MPASVRQKKRNCLPFVTLVLAPTTCLRFHTHIHAHEGEGRHCGFTHTYTHMRGREGKRLGICRGKRLGRREESEINLSSQAMLLIGLHRAHTVLCALVKAMVHRGGGDSSGLDTNYPPPPSPLAWRGGGAS